MTMVRDILRETGAKGFTARMQQSCPLRKFVLRPSTDYRPKQGRISDFRKTYVSPPPPPVARATATVVSYILFAHLLRPIAHVRSATVFFSPATAPTVAAL